MELQTGTNNTGVKMNAQMLQLSFCLSKRGNVGLGVKGWVMKSHWEPKAWHKQRTTGAQCHCKARREEAEREGGAVGHEVGEIKT